MDRHDTAGFIERTAKQFAVDYKRGYAESNPNWRPKHTRATLTYARLWMVKEYRHYIAQAMNETDRIWFFTQRPNYRSTLVWKIFIRFSELASKAMQVTVFYNNEKGGK